MTKAIQTRGHCPKCGAIQAVNGSMSKHGYTVKSGWFQGVCSGDFHQPIEVNREVADETVANVRLDVSKLEADLVKMREGKVFPLTIEDGGHIVNGKWETKFVPFAEARKHVQESAVKSMIFHTESRIRSGQTFANDFEALINRVHGQPLIEVVKPTAADRIQAGEKRVTEFGQTLVAKYQEAARVYYTRTNERGVYNG
jgi:hypothetical protein